MIKGRLPSNKGPQWLNLLARSLFKCGEQLADCPPGDGIDGLGSNLGEWLEHETTPPQPRMGDGQLRRAYDLIREKQQVEIQGPRAPANDSNPAKLRFDLLKNPEQPVRVEIGLQDGSRVQILSLTGWTSHGFGFVKRAYVPDTDPLRPGQSRDCSLERGTAVAQVAAQTDPGERQHGLSAMRVYSLSLPIRSTASTSRGVSTVKAARM
jgi:hypothetical protein